MITIKSLVLKNSNGISQVKGQTVNQDWILFIFPMILGMTSDEDLDDSFSKYCQTAEVKTINIVIIIIIRIFTIIIIIIIIFIMMMVSIKQRPPNTQ